jgi:hypothetical protein
VGEYALKWNWKIGENCPKIIESESMELEAR